MTDGPVGGQDMQRHSIHAGVEQWSTQVDQQEQCYNAVDAVPQKSSETAGRTGSSQV